MGMKKKYLVSLKKDGRIKGHELTLVTEQYRLDITKYSFSQRTINECTQLSTNYANASSVYMFRKKIYKYLRRAYIDEKTGHIFSIHI